MVGDPDSVSRCGRAVKSAGDYLGAVEFTGSSSGKELAFVTSLGRIGGPFRLRFSRVIRFIQEHAHKVSRMATQIFAVQEYHHHERLAAARRLRVLSYVGWGYLALLTVLIAFVVLTW